MTKRLKEIMLATCLALAPFAGNGAARADSFTNPSSPFCPANPLNPMNPAHPIRNYDSKPEKQAENATKERIEIDKPTEYTIIGFGGLLLAAAGAAAHGIYKDYKSGSKERKEEFLNQTKKSVYSQKSQ